VSLHLKIAVIGLFWGEVSKITIMMGRETTKIVVLNLRMMMMEEI
jgi:hypothetical protein